MHSWLSGTMACNSILVTINSRSLLRVPRLGAPKCRQTHGEANGQTGTTKKPNLRQAPKNDKPRNVAILACVLAAIYMYPMIFRPMFGIGQSSDEGKLEDLKTELSKRRPSFMPEWSSPFEPKQKD